MADHDELLAAAQRLNRLSTPYNAYRLWQESGDTWAADVLTEWDEARLALKEAAFKVAAGGGETTPREGWQCEECRASWPISWNQCQRCGNRTRVPAGGEETTPAEEDVVP